MAKDDLMTKQDVMDYLKISHQTLYRLMKKRETPYFKLERKVLFRKAEIDKWLESKIIK